MASPYRHPTTGTYYLRRKLPQDVRHAFDNRELYKLSLGTKDLTKAKQEFTLANAELEKRIIEARANVAYSPAASLQQWFSRRRGNDQLGKRRKTVLLMRLDLCVSMHDAAIYETEKHLRPISDWNRLLSSDHALEQKLVDQYEDPDRPGMRWGLWRAWKRDRKQWEKLIDDEVDSLIDTMPAIACERHEIAQEMIDHLVDGFVIKIDRDGDPRVWKSPVEADYKPEMPFSEVFEQWAKRGNITEKTKREFRVALADFISFADDPPIGRIEKHLVTKYYELAARLPASLPRKVRALGLRQRVAWAERERPGAERISPATLKKRITAISAVACFAYRKDIIDFKPALNVQIDNYDRNSSTRRLFSAEEMRAYFDAPLFTDPNFMLDRSTDADHLTAAWVSLIALTIGCRLSEAAQIQVGDIQMRDGAWCFIFTQEKHDTGKRDDDKHYKATKTIYVPIPIPELLIDLHFLHFVDARRSDGQRHLFPEIFEQHYRVQKLSDFLNAHIDKYVTTNQNLVFHSLRHWFKSKGRIAMGEENAREIQRHSPQSSSEKYGRGDIPALKDGIDRISYDALPLSKIHQTFDLASKAGWKRE